MTRFLPLLALLGCGLFDGPLTEATTEIDGGLRVETRQASTRPNGLLAVEVEIEEGTTAVQVVGESGEFVSFERVIDPENDTRLTWEDWYYSPYSLTYAIFGFDRATAINWPIRKDEGTLTPGTWTFELSTLDNQGYYVGEADVDLTIVSKVDPDFKNGNVVATIAWAQGMEDDPDVVEGVEAAVERWREVWAGMGATLEVTYESTNLDPLLPFANTGGQEVATATADKPTGNLFVVIGDEVDGESDTYGIAGGIPGPLPSTTMTYVVASWLTHAGPNGKLDDEESRLMGETLAHEAGHFIGLFHPVEFGYEYFDALSDTPECGGYVDCEAEMADNLMYPYPICDYSAGTCLPQDVLTKEQQDVAHRYVGIN